ncbi:MAG: acetyl-CoA carboxylase biotin carboxylase subunit [Gammaproteobacteria bacterium]|nr:acetyl-CoA carboxylase biotin carboxylase subunit [Gammaproteobacteria bacterium]
MLKKLLIANRGEIAVRIVRSCAEMGIRSVAIYSDADRHSLHVKKADEAHSIGAESVAGYLNAHRIVNLAVATGCDAIHPGYGFLSEDPLLAEICARRNIIFVGPRAETIRLMGDKLEARAVAKKIGVPLVPASDKSLESVEEAIQLAEKIGYPIMLKALGGGGGRGIRRCANKQELSVNYDRVKSEVSKAFSNTEIFLEKCIENAKHIEVQILGDKYNNIVHLFERDCSIQRRHQKLIELAPSPQLTEAMRLTVTNYALKLAQEVNYENAGTVEFLLDNNNFYFMEMNTRLQVEHTVTEEITGIDIVNKQLEIAAGLELKLKQSDITKNGYAAQFRINCEDPKNNFLPSFGKISQYYSPGGHGVRTDAAIYTGYDIPPYYDSLCAKLTVWAMNWPELIKRGQRALQEMVLFGVRTTIPYYLEILKTEKFQNANIDTNFIEQNSELTRYPERTTKHAMATVLAAACAHYYGFYNDN